MANITEIVFILDKSGSMGGLEKDTIGGYNAMLKKQMEATEVGEARITTVLFDNNYEILHDRLNLKAVKPITEKEYFVGGSTALLDAIGKTINKIVAVQRSCAEEYRADKVIFVITTDGMENASREFSYPQIKKMIETEQSKYGWEFIFLGANIDAIEAGDSLGIRRSNVRGYHADGQGTEALYDSASEAVFSMRCCAKVSEAWAERVDADNASREQGKRKKNKA